MKNTTAATPTTHVVHACRGMDPEPGCPHTLASAPGFADRLNRVAQESGWPRFLLAKHARLHRHHAFRIHVSACPNGCARPHIADIGLIRACVPGLDPDACTGCGECARGCPDQAIAMHAEVPAIDREACLRCGHCMRLCPAGAMRCHAEGWRVLAGGRLGRRPRLAVELPGLHDDDQAEAIVRRALELRMGTYDEYARFGLLLDEVGAQVLLEEDGA